MPWATHLLHRCGSHVVVFGEVAVRRLCLRGLWICFSFFFWTGVWMCLDDLPAEAILDALSGTLSEESGTQAPRGTGLSEGSNAQATIELPTLNRHQITSSTNQNSTNKLNLTLGFLS